MTTSGKNIRIGIGAKLLAAAFAVVVGFGLCEVAARAFYPAPPEPLREPQLLYQFDPKLRFIHVPNQSGYLDDGLATINGMGLRGEEAPVPKPPGELRILAVGDSTTFGWGVGDGETYCAYLEAQLNAAHPDLQIRVVNGGVGAYDLERSVGLLRHFGPILRPDIVIIGFFWNDLPYEAVSPDGVPQKKSSASPERAAGAGRSSKPFRIGNNPSRLNQILRRSRALYVMRHAWLAAVAPTEVADNLVQWEMALLGGRQTPAIDVAWDSIGKTLAEVRELAEAGRFAVGVLIIPIRAQVEENHPQAAYQTRVRALAEAQGFFVVDPLARLIAAPDREGLFIPYDRMHFSARGNAVMAEAAFEAVAARPELQRRNPTPVSEDQRQAGGMQ